MRPLIILLLSVVTVLAPTGYYLVWNPNPPEEEVEAYYIEAAPEITGPWVIIGSTPGTNYPITILNQRQFYRCFASNFWATSPYSETASTPATVTSVLSFRTKREN